MRSINWSKEIPNVKQNEVEESGHAPSIVSLETLKAWAKLAILQKNNLERTREKAQRIIRLLKEGETVIISDIQSIDKTCGNTFPSQSCAIAFVQAERNADRTMEKLLKIVNENVYTLKR